jgi:A118 family predicted phage portal protein
MNDKTNVNITQQEVIKYLKTIGYEVDESMYKYINVWYEWFKGKVESFHSYMHYNGITYSKKERYSLGMPKKICESWADLLLNEKVWVTVDEADQDMVNALLEDVNFRTQANQLIEKSFALGTGAFVEYKNFLSTPKVNYLIAPMIFPLRNENGEVVDCAFASYKGKNTYYVQIHTLQDNGSYKITNKYFSYNPQTKEIKNTPVSIIKTIMKPAFTSRVKLFQLVFPNITNNIDMFSSMGLSVYANAIDQIKTVDLVFDSFKNEFELGKKRVYVKTGAINVKISETGETIPIFDENQTEFFAIPGDDEDGKDLVTESDSDLRVTEHVDGLDTSLNILSDNCGFGSDYFSFKDGKVYTNTTQVISTNSKLYRTLKKHELVIGPSIVGLVKGLIYLKTGKIYTGDITVDFDDSIIQDTDAIKKQAQLEVNMGLRDAIEYYQTVDGLTEEQAIEYYNKIQARKPKIVDEPNPEE